METINEVLSELLGSYKLSYYITFGIFVLIGVIISVRLQAHSRDKESQNTPLKFSVKFMIQDNILRIISSLAIVFVAVRLGEEVFSKVPTYGAALIMGLTFDQILIQIEKIQKRARN